jgi:Flp pilus assembly protein TadG
LFLFSFCDLQGDAIMNHHRTTERGQALILIALAAVGLFAFSALAIDGSRSYSNKRHAQNAADTSVLAGALAAIRCTNGTPNPCSQAEAFAAAKDAAEKRATSNGFTTGTNGRGDVITVEVNLCSDAGVTCEGLPATAEKAEYIRVRIVSKIPATFGRVIGRQTLSSAVEAIARVHGSSAFSSFPGQAVVALSPDDCGVCATGGGNLKVYGSGIFSNSTAADCSGNNKSSIVFWGTSDIYSEQGYSLPAAGAMCVGAGTNILDSNGNPIYPPPPPSKASQVAPVYDIPAPEIPCSGTGWLDSTRNEVHPGNFASKETINSGDWTFLPGNYCFANGFVNKGNTIAHDVNFRIDGGQFEARGDIFTCSNMTVYGAGGDGIQFNGNGSVQCTSVTFYLASGGVHWNGNSSKNQLSARTSGPYKGLLIYLPSGNDSGVLLNGNSNSSLVGSVIAPSSTISLKGNSNSAGYDSQLVGWKIDIEGTANTIIKFNPAHQYKPPANPTIQLTK